VDRLKREKGISEVLSMLREHEQRIMDILRLMVYLERRVNKLEEELRKLKETHDLDIIKVYDYIDSIKTDIHDRLGPS